MKSVILSASDPGGGNSLLPIVGGLSGDLKLLFVLGGASRELFKKAGIEFIDGDALNESELRDLVHKFKPDLFIAGSSFGPTIDKRIFEILKGKVKSIYILDFWSNYWQRFSADKVKDFKYLPYFILNPFQ